MAQTYITPTALAAALHRADAPTIIDMRDADDSAADPRRIPGALPITLADLDAGTARSGPVVCMCQKGGKLSQLGAAILRSRGGVATNMSGGHLEWVALDLPLMAAAPLTERWVMPLDPTWQELAALWLLRRLINRSARVMAVERDWLVPATGVWAAQVLPSDPADLARMAKLDHPMISRLAGGPEALLAGRLTRISAPEDALDLIDDWLAGAAVAA